MSKTEDNLNTICKRLRCSIIAMDLGKLDHARDMLSKLQNQEVFERIFGPDPNEESQEKECVENVDNTTQSNANQQTDRGNDEAKEDISLKSFDICEEYVGEEESGPPCVCIKSDHIRSRFVYEDLPEDTWHGYFGGYQILSENDEFNINENKKCIEITKNDCDEDLDAYLRNGIRCFVIDLFAGTEIENQVLIVRLRENEIKISKEHGFPVTTTLFAKLSPRLQYVGLLEQPDSTVGLNKGDEITLTTDRYWSTRGTKKRIYVNALFLLQDVKPCNFLLIGPSIQVQVKQVLPDRLRCIVAIGGELKSRLPVLFPGQCNKFRISVEELEDLTFAKEVGINVVVSYIAGSKEYCKHLRECMRLLHCERMRLCARVVLNEVKGCEKEMLWAADNYDGVLIEINPQQQDKVGEDNCEVMHLCPAAEKFVERVYELKKPIIFDPTLISNHRILVDPVHNMHVFYYPDKYVFKCDRSRNSFYFYYLQNAQFSLLPEQQLARLTFCDDSHTGSDSLARACAAASIESNAAAIFVCSLTGRMAIKIAHYRPKTPIILITSMKSASDYISMYHHIVMLYYRGKEQEGHRQSVFKHFLFGLVYAKSRHLICNDQKVILVYGKEEGTKFPDKYILYKFDEQHFSEHLNKTLFTS